MCDIDDDGFHSSLWSERQRRARIDHECDGCGGLIGIGEIYLLHFSVCEGYVDSGRMCIECELIRQEFSDAHDGMTCTPSGLSWTLSGCIAEGDEESDTKWSPMLDAMMARGRAVGRPWRRDVQAAGGQ